MPLGWIKGQRPFPHHPQGIRDGVTLVQTNLKRNINSRVGNVSPYLSVFQDKFLAELAKEICVVCAADYSNFRGVRGDGVTQVLICYKKLKTLLPGDVFGWRTFHGEFRYNTRGKFGKFGLKPPAALTPRVHMGPIVKTAVPRRSAELPPPCLSKDVPHDRSLRSLSNSVSHFRFCSSFSFFILSKLTLKAVSVSR